MTPVHNIGAALLVAVQLLLVGVAVAHEGHDHDAPPPLNLPVAPRVVAVTPDYELVGVLSGEHRLTIFLHRFETGEPVKDARIFLSAGEQEIEAVRKEHGVFNVSAPWISAAEPMDIVFRLKLPNDEDILTGRLEKASATTAPAELASASTSQFQQTVYVAIGALMTGVLLTLLAGASLSRRRKARSAAETQNPSRCRDGGRSGSEGEAAPARPGRGSRASLCGGAWT